MILVNNVKVYFSGVFLRYPFICFLKGLDYARGRKSSILDSSGYHGRH